MFTPSITNGLVANYFAGAQAGYVDGQNVATLIDQTGNDNGFTANLAPPKFSATAFNGRGGLTFAGSNGMSAPHDKIDILGGGYTLVWVAEFNTAIGYDVILKKNQIDSNALFRLWFTTQGTLQRHGASNGLEFKAHAQRLGAPTVMAYSYAPTAANVGTERWWVEGRVSNTRTGAVDGTDAATDWILADSWTSGKLGQWLVYNRVLSTGELAQLEVELNAYWGIARGAVNINLNGNSLSQFGARPYPETVFKSIPNDLMYIGWSGKAITDMRADFANGNYGQPVPGKINVAVVDEGQNGLHFVNSANEFFDAYIAHAQELTDAGWLVIISTLQPSSFFDSAREGYRVSGNQRMRDMENPPWVALVDQGRNALIGLPGANLTATYYVDGTHMSDVGYDIKAGLFITAIADVIRQQSQQGLTTAELNAIAASVAALLPTPVTPPTASQNATALLTTQVQGKTVAARLDLASATGKAFNDDKSQLLLRDGARTVATLDLNRETGEIVGVG